MSDADCTPGREPRSVAASSIYYYKTGVISGLACGFGKISLALVIIIIIRPYYYY